MFKSKRRAIVIPQSEHLKLAGTLALLWGNAEFELPPLERQSVVAGIALHDRGYGYLDHVSIGEADDDEWLAITRRGFYMPAGDPVADLVTRHHLLRLAARDDPPPARRALAQEMRAVIAAQIEQHGLDAELLRRVDRMTQLCDHVSFEFCFEAPAEGQVQVFARYGDAGATAIHYRVAGNVITLNPWPLQVTEYSGYLVGYQQAGYPDRLESLIVPFQLHPAAA